MATMRHLSNAPIVEALIDVRTVPAAGLDFERLRHAFEADDFGYYVKGPITEGFLALELQADGLAKQSNSEATRVGLRLHSRDEKYVLQCRLGGFTLSRLQPYEDWHTLQEEARRLWQLYCQRLDPAFVTRIATRFINNLRLPLDNNQSFQKYVVKLLDLPAGVPQHVIEFFQRFVLWDREVGGTVALTIALSEAPTEGRYPVILDIDAFITTEIKPCDPALWDNLTNLRAAKNRAFFGTVTDAAMELYT